MVRATELGLDWATAEALAEEELEQRLYGPRLAAGAQRPLPDPVYIHKERKRTGVTLELLHLEYLCSTRTATGTRSSARFTVSG